VNVYNINGEVVEEMELSDDIFGIEINEHAVYEVVKNQLANKRQGTQSATTRAEVRGGGRKPWRQKWTGRARQGSIRSPQWKGGGVVFAPKPRDYSYSVPKKVKRLALKSVLTSKVVENEMIVVDDLKLNAPKTKEMINIFNSLKTNKKSLIVIDKRDENVILAARNIPNVQTAYVNP
ncbi:50S ribosomal protein L4, partial [Vibrio parahaemolyticus]|nr:50S ribosomal protein L4 [Vibrio parahaemolyticus]